MKGERAQVRAQTDALNVAAAKSPGAAAHVARLKRLDRVLLALALLGPCLDVVHLWLVPHTPGGMLSAVPEDFVAVCFFFVFWGPRRRVVRIRTTAEEIMEASAAER